MDFEILASGYWNEVDYTEVVTVPDSQEPEPHDPEPTETIDPDFIEVSNMLLGSRQSPEPTATPTATPEETTETELSDAETIQLLHDCAVGIMSMNFVLALTLLLLFINKFFGN